MDFNNFMLDPKKLALLNAGVNMLAASRGGNTDLTKGGLGYGLQQGLLGAAQGYEMGNQFKDKAREDAVKEQFMGLLGGSQAQGGMPTEGGILGGTKLPNSPVPQQQPQIGLPQKPQLPFSPAQAQAPTQPNMFDILTPQEKAMAGMMVQSGDIKGVYAMLDNRREMNRKQNMMTGGFENKKDYITAMQQTRKLATDQLKKSRTTLDKFGQATDIVTERGGFDKMNGADDTILMKGFASMILPGEAVMSDDIRIIAQQEGVPGWFKSYAAQLEGGQLTESQRATIYNSMSNLANRAFKENTSARKKFESDIKYGGFKESDILDPQLSYSPYSTKPSGSKVPRPINTLSPDDYEAY